MFFPVRVGYDAIPPVSLKLSNEMRVFPSPSYFPARLIPGGVSLKLDFRDVLEDYDPMTVTLNLPDEVFAAAGVPEGRVEDEARKELALAFYGRGILSCGKACELAGTSRMEFDRLLKERKIVRAYDVEDLETDLEWAGYGVSPG